MTGRTRLSADERREQLMEATIIVLDERGFKAATADEIARRAAVSKGLLWHYFADLSALFEITAHHALRSLASAVGRSIDLDGTAPTVIRSAIHAATALRATHGRERRALREIAMNLRTATREPVFGPKFNDENYAAQEAIFRRGQADGDFRHDLDPRLVAVTYQGIVDSMLSYLDTYPDTDADRYADTVAEILLRGLSPTDPSGAVD